MYYRFTAIYSFCPRFLDKEFVCESTHSLAY